MVENGSKRITFFLRDDGDNGPVFAGSAIKDGPLNDGSKIGRYSNVFNDAVDTWIELQEKDVDKLS